MDRKLSFNETGGRFKYLKTTAMSHVPTNLVKCIHKTMSMEVLPGQNGNDLKENGQVLSIKNMVMSLSDIFLVNSSCFKLQSENKNKVCSS